MIISGKYVRSGIGSVIFFQLLTFFSGAQTTVNAYAKVTGVTNNSVLALSNVNVANHTFTVGGQVIVMQMQDNVIGTNTANNSSFGNLNAIGNAGVYELKTIAAVTPTSGTPTSVTLTTALANTFNTGSNSAVQMISFRDLGANYTTSANISAPAWNGNVGGVIAFYTAGTLTINHQILADGIGFRGGAVSNNAGGDLTCVNTSYTSTLTTLGRKGEGIYLPTVTAYTIGRGKLINGGGGGAENNAGGGGGGNYTSGGDGGLGYPCTTANSGRGIGGLSLSTNISASRVFMGGGGGGGQANNGVATAGGAGGGIIFARANTIATSSTCVGGARFSANGVSATNSGNDGAGGGGAGGSIVIDAISFSATSTCTLTLRANGGNGGTVGNGAAHGGGGGGGQGAVIYSSAQPTVNVGTQTTNGSPGGDTNTGTINAGPGGGTNNSGVIAPSIGPLPIELIEFKATKNYDRVLIQWSTASEKNNAYFTVERSVDGISYTYVASVQGAGTSGNINTYSVYDNSPVSGISYYRLKQVDLDGSYEYSQVVSVDREDNLEVTLTPNPVQAGEIIQFTLSKQAQQIVTVEITDLMAAVTYTGTAGSDDGVNFVVNNYYPPQGVYLVTIKCGDAVVVSRLMVQ